MIHLPVAPILLADIGGILFLPVVMAGLAFWVWMLVDCANEEKECANKIAWLLIILFVGIIGAPLYYLLRKLPRQRPAAYQPPPGLIQPWREH